MGHGLQSPVRNHRWDMTTQYLPFGSLREGRKREEQKQCGDGGRKKRMYRGVSWRSLDWFLSVAWSVTYRLSHLASTL